MNFNLKQVFINSAGGLLLAAGIIRVLITFGNASILNARDPLLDIPIRYAALIIGTTELAIASVCLFGKTTRLQIGLVLWLTVFWGVCRVGLLLDHSGSQWTPFGGLTNPLQLSPAAVAWIEDLTLFYLFIGALSFFVHDWKWKVLNPVLKMHCPSCGVHIQFDARNLSQTMPCPCCQDSIILRTPGNLRMSCFFCKEHIEFPSHALGEKMPCPHCKMGITLKEQTVGRCPS